MSDDHSRQTDSELFSRLQNEGSARDAAFAEIYARYSRQAYVYCLKVMNERSQAEDIFQETFLRLLRSANEGRSMTNLPAYIMRIARNLCLEQKRFETKKFVDLEDIELHSFETEVESNELQRLLELALETLSPEHREAFVLQAYNGLSYSEIAELTDVPLSTVRNRVVRAKQKVRSIISRYFLEDPK